MPKGKSGPQPDLKIEKVCLLCTVWESKLVFEATIMLSGETTEQELSIQILYLRINITFPLLGNSWPLKMSGGDVWHTSLKPLPIF